MRAFLYFINIAQTQYLRNIIDLMLSTSFCRLIFYSIQRTLSFFQELTYLYYCQYPRFLIPIYYYLRFSSPAADCRLKFRYFSSMIINEKRTPQLLLFIIIASFFLKPPLGRQSVAIKKSTFVVAKQKI